MAKFFGSLAGKVVVAAVLAAAILFGISQCQNAGREADRADLSADQAEAGSESAKDAIGTVGAVSDRNTASDQTTAENADAIRNAPGADSPVDPRAHDAGLRGLCRRAAYRGKPECMRLAPAE